MFSTYWNTSWSRDEQLVPFVTPSNAKVLYTYIHLINIQRPRLCPCLRLSLPSNHSSDAFSTPRSFGELCPTFRIPLTPYRIWHVHAIVSFYYLLLHSGFHCFQSSLSVTTDHFLYKNIPPVKRKCTLHSHIRVLQIDSLSRDYWIPAYLLSILHFSPWIQKFLL